MQTKHLKMHPVLQYVLTYPPPPPTLGQITDSCARIAVGRQIYRQIDRRLFCVDYIKSFILQQR